MDKSDSSVLNKTIKWLTRGNKFHICIHDASGILHHIPQLSIPIQYKIHSSRFCDCSKTTTTGLKWCLKCKAFSIRKAVRQKEMYIGICYLGLTEIVKPVYLNGKLLCIIYIGNIILDESKKDTVRIERVCKKTGVHSDLLVNQIETAEIIAQAELKEYAEVIEVLENCICSFHDEIKKQMVRTAIKEQSGRRHWIIQAVENYITLYYSNDINLSHLAKLYFINPQYLCRLFRRETGESFSEYVNRVRLAKAKELLTSSKDGILSISMQVGYNNVSYFNRMFKKTTGMSPGQFRNQNISE